MAILPALVVLLLLEALAAVALVGAGSRLRQVGDRRLAIEAALMLETAIARTRVAHDTTIAALGPGAVAVLPPPPLPEWAATAVAARDGASPLVTLEVAVRRRDSAGNPLAARRGTLLLTVGATDTAIVLENRARW